MTKYFVKAAHVATPPTDDGLSGCDWDAYQDRATTVYEQDIETFTGLFDKNGNEIHRSEKIGLGFGRKS